MVVLIKNEVTTIWHWYLDLLEKNSKDVVIFHVSLAISIAFLPILISFVSPQGLHIPIVIAFLAISIRLIVKSSCRESFIKTGKKFGFFVFILFWVYIMLNILKHNITVNTHLDPAPYNQAIFLGMIICIFIYIWSSPDEAYRLPLLSFSKIGVLSGVLLFLALFIWNQIIYQLDIPAFFPYGFKVLIINRALMVLSIYLFFLLSTAERKELPLFLIMIGLLWFLSFFTVGTQPKHDANFYQISSETVQFGVIFSLMVFFLARRWPKPVTHLVFTVITSVLLFAPWIYQKWYDVAENMIPFKAHLILDRMKIWDASAKKILEHPWFGQGIDSLSIFKDLEFRKPYGYAVPDHSHNGILQLWMDLGVLGVCFALVFIIAAWRFSLTIDKPRLPSILAMITMMFLAIIVTHKLWNTWWMSALAFMVILIVLIKPKKKNIGSVS